MFFRVAWLPAVLCACASPPQSTADPVLSKAQDPKPAKKWQPPAPDPKDFDWIRLKSGEWLKGDLKALREDELEFDSDELDLLELDWEDVPELRSPRENAVGLVDRVTAIGTVLVVDGQIVVGTETGPKIFRRADIISIVPGRDTTVGFWSGALSFGATLRSGNTDETTTNTRVTLMRRSPFSRISLDYIGNFSEIDSSKNTDNQRFDGTWDLFVSKKWFISPARIDVYRDRFLNIAYQITPSAGVGYHMVDEADFEFDLTLGAGWKYTKFDSTLSGGDESQDTFAAIPGLRIDWDITKDIEFVVNVSSQLGVTDTEQRTTNLDGTLSIDLTENFDFNVTLQWDRVANPERDSGGDIPEKDDVRVTIGLEWEF